MITTNTPRPFDGLLDVAIEWVASDDLRGTVPSGGDTSPSGAARRRASDRRGREDHDRTSTPTGSRPRYTYRRPTRPAGDSTPENAHEAPVPEIRQQAANLLDFLTPFQNGSLASVGSMPVGGSTARRLAAAQGAYQSRASTTGRRSTPHRSYVP